MKKLSTILLLVLVAAGLTLPIQTLAALSYDPYDSTPRNPDANNYEELKKQEKFRNMVDLPFLPLKAASWGTQKLLNWADSTHFPRKVKWFWEDVLHENGVYPETRFSPRALGVGAGATLELEKLTRLDEKIPFLKVHATGGATIKGDADVGGSYELFQAEGLQFYHKGIFDFVHKENENFYGLGPRTSRGDGYSYEINTTRLRAEVGFKPISSVSIDGAFQYRHVTVHNGDVSGAGNFDHFNTGSLPGHDGGKIITVETGIQHDTRDFPGDPTSGGLQKFTASFNRDTRHNDNYFKYYLELSQYFKLWSHRRVLAVHFSGEHVQDVNHSSIPFFDMARLGGYGTQPAGSTTLRGYKYNRFFDKSSAALNAEYRYNVWEYGNFGADWVFFADVGKVFGDLHEFGKGGMRVSYGTGIRLKAHRNVFFSFQVARSSEGTELYFRTKTPF